MHNVSLKLAASLLVLAVASAPAAAQDAKNYPGVACNATGSNNASVARQATTGRAFNQATTEIAFVCPAVKDFASIAGGHAWVIDQNPSAGATVTCWVLTGRPDSLTVQSSADTTDPAGGTFSSSAPVELMFGGLSATSDGFYWLFCDVPGTFNGAQSGVVMYQVTENE